MKHIIILLLSVGLLATAYGQNPETLRQLKSIEGQYTYVKEDGAVVYSQVVQMDSLTRSQIYERARTYLVKNYGVNKWTEFQLADEGAGLIQVQGLLDTSLIKKGLTILAYMGVYKARVEVKDGRARVSVLLSGVKKSIDISMYDIPIYGIYPFNQLDMDKNASGQAFYLFHHAALRELARLVKNMFFTAPAADDW